MKIRHTGGERSLLLGTSLLAASLLGMDAASAADDKDNLEEVVVTGIRASLTQGLENKKDATQVVESVVAEDIGKLPDNNVIEALQRVTGVQVTNRGGGEADGI